MNLREVLFSCKFYQIMLNLSPQNLKHLSLKSSLEVNKFHCQNSNKVLRANTLSTRLCCSKVIELLSQYVYINSVRSVRSKLFGSINNPLFMTDIFSFVIFSSNIQSELHGPITTRCFHTINAGCLAKQNNPVYNHR